MAQITPTHLNVTEVTESLLKDMLATQRNIKSRYPKSVIVLQHDYYCFLLGGDAQSCAGFLDIEPNTIGGIPYIAFHQRGLPANTVRLVKNTGGVAIADPTITHTRARSA